MLVWILGGWLWEGRVDPQWPGDWNAMASSDLISSLSHSTVHTHACPSLVVLVSHLREAEGHIPSHPSTWAAAADFTPRLDGHGVVPLLSHGVSPDCRPGFKVAATHANGRAQGGAGEGGGRESQEGA